MKVSVSVPRDDVDFLDAYAREHALPSRSAVVHAAVRALRLAELPEMYDEAWAEWTGSGEADVWEASVGDGLA